MCSPALKVFSLFRSCKSPDAQAETLFVGFI